MLRVRENAVVWSARSKGEVSSWERKPGKRGNAMGWTPGTKRRCINFVNDLLLPCIDPEEFVAFTLTSRTCAPTAKGQRELMRAVFNRLNAGGGRRWFYIVEFNRQRVPHYHGLIEGVTQADVWRAWEAVMGPYGVDLRAQDVRHLEGREGWFGYLRSHAGKGGVLSSEGQRSNSQAPQAWLDDGSLGRMWHC